MFSTNGDVDLRRLQLTLTSSSIRPFICRRRSELVKRRLVPGQLRNFIFGSNYSAYPIRQYLKKDFSQVVQIFQHVNIGR